MLNKLLNNLLLKQNLFEGQHHGKVPFMKVDGSTKVANSELKALIEEQMQWNPDGKLRIPSLIV
jgi:hypothetical protein